MTRALLALACALLLVLAIHEFLRFAESQDRALALVEQHGLGKRHPGLDAEVGRHYDPIFAELRVARALLEDELDRSWMSGLSATDQRLELGRGMERLREARALAKRSWPRRPSSWEAALVLGGATYLELFRTRDPRLMADSELWERPLLAAHRLGPSETGPVRFLAAAYLGNWSSLSSEQKTTTTDLLAKAFQERRTYRLLIRDWLRVAPSRRQALALIPDRPWAWEILEEIFSEARDQELEVVARRQRYRSLLSDRQRVIAQARRALEVGEERQARYLLLTLLEDLPRSLEFAPALDEILALLPPGPTGSGHAATFGAWLDWAFELCVLSECPVGEAALGRLARLSGDLLPSQRALAFLLSGDPPRARLIERRFALTSSEEWASYFLLDAELLAREGRFEAAVESLARLPSSWLERPRYWIASRTIGELADDADMKAASAEALDRLSRSGWSNLDWQRQDDLNVLELLVPIEARGLRLEIVDASPPGAVFDVLWDGRLIATDRTTATRAELDLELSVVPGLHRLELLFHSGGRARPGGVSLI